MKLYITKSLNDMGVSIERNKARLIRSADSNTKVKGKVVPVL